MPRYQATHRCEPKRECHLELQLLIPTYVGDTSHSVQETDKTLDDTKPLGREAAEHILNISEFKPHEPCACHTSCDRKGVEGLVVIESVRLNKRGTFALPLVVWP